MTLGIAGVSDTVTAVPYFFEYSRSRSRSWARSRSFGISWSGFAPQAVISHPAAAAAAHDANSRRDETCGRWRDRAVHLSIGELLVTSAARKDGRARASVRSA